MTGQPMVPDEDTIDVESYEVHAAILYGQRFPAGQGAVVLCLRGTRNGDGSPTEVQVTIPPEVALMLTRDVRQAFQRVPVEFRHPS